MAELHVEKSGETDDLADSGKPNQIAAPLSPIYLINLT